MYTLVFHQEQARSSVVYSEVSVLASTKIVHSGPSSLHRHVRHYDSGAPFLHRHVRSCTSETSLFRRHVHSCTSEAVFSPQARSFVYSKSVVSAVTWIVHSGRRFSAGTFVRVPRSLHRERARSINAHKGAMEATKQKLRDQQSETYAHSIVSQANATVLEITREAKRSVDQAKKVHWGSSP